VGALPTYSTSAPVVSTVYRSGLPSAAPAGLLMSPGEAMTGSALAGSSGPMSVCAVPVGSAVVLPPFQFWPVEPQVEMVCWVFGVRLAAGSVRHLPDEVFVRPPVAAGVYCWIAEPSQVSMTTGVL
jgi:hypothetical protein